MQNIVSYDLVLFMLKIETTIRETNSMPFPFSDGIICGPHWGSFAVRHHLRYNLGIISGLGIICGQGSFAVLRGGGEHSATPGTFLCLDHPTKSDVTSGKKRLSEGNFF